MPHDILIHLNIVTLDLITGIILGVVFDVWVSSLADQELNSVLLPALNGKVEGGLAVGIGVVYVHLVFEKHFTGFELSFEDVPRENGETLTVFLINIWHSPN